MTGSRRRRKGKKEVVKMTRPLAVFTRALVAVAIALTAAAPASAQAVNAGGSATGTGTFDFGGPSTLTLAVTGTPQAAAGPVALSLGMSPAFTYTGEARCIAIDETPTGFRASIAGEITGGPALLLLGLQGFQLTVYDNTPSAQPDEFGSDAVVTTGVQTTCEFDFARGPEVKKGNYVIRPAGACPPGDDEDGDGLNDGRERLFSTLLGNSDSDRDGIKDGNDDANGNGEDDEDEDDDDECPDEDSDGDGEDDEDEDDD
jgi:hypothetical protein